jgi:hypothetical protein
MLLPVLPNPLSRSATEHAVGTTYAKRSFVLGDVVCEEKPLIALNVQVSDTTGDDGCAMAGDKQ